jgi:hypothetical protein
LQTIQTRPNYIKTSGTYAHSTEKINTNTSEDKGIYKLKTRQQILQLCQPDKDINEMIKECKMVNECAKERRSQYS